MKNVTKEKLLMTFNVMGKNGTTSIDLVVFLLSMVLGAVAMDFDLIHLKVVSGFLFLGEVMWCLCNFISLVLTEIIIRKRNKRTNIEKLIEEEEQKEEGKK